MARILQCQRFGSTQRVKFVNPPRQSIDRRSPLTDQVFTSIHQQLHLTRHLVVASDRQIRLPQDCPRNGQRIDGIRLPGLRETARDRAVKLGGTRTTR